MMRFIIIVIYAGRNMQFNYSKQGDYWMITADRIGSKRNYVYTIVKDEDRAREIILKLRKIIIDMKEV